MPKDNEHRKKENNTAKGMPNRQAESNPISLVFMNGSQDAVYTEQRAGNTVHSKEAK